MESGNAALLTKVDKVGWLVGV